MRTEDQITAARLGVSERVNSLREALGKIHGFLECDIDLESLAEIRYISLLPRWDEKKHLQAPDFYEKRRAFLLSVLEVCAANGLTRTEDALEDYGGGWFYIVLRCDWPFSA